MYTRSIIGVIMTVMLIGFGCSTGIIRPGTSGKSTSQKIKSGHPKVPDGLGCFSCHKRERPDAEFHRAFGVTCENCHGTTTWMAYKYPHDKWALGLHRKMQCGRCHENMATFDFSTWQCWGCHHEQDKIAASHKLRGKNDISNCIACHKVVKSEVTSE